MIIERNPNVTMKKYLFLI